MKELCIYMSRIRLKLTWKIPWIELIDVELLYELDRERALLDLSLEVKTNKLLICRVKTKPWQHHFIYFILICCTHITATTSLLIHTTLFSSSPSLEQYLPKTLNLLPKLLKV